MSDTFIYTIPFEAKAVLRVEKSQIVDAVSMRVGRHLTAEEGNKVWADIKHGDYQKTSLHIIRIFSDVDCVDLRQIKFFLKVVKCTRGFWLRVH